MGNELNVTEQKFFETNVEGKWKDSSLVCSDNLYCSDYIFVE